MFHKQVDLKADHGTNGTLHTYKVCRLAGMNGKTSRITWHKTPSFRPRYTFYIISCPEMKSEWKGLTLGEARY